MSKYTDLAIELIELMGGKKNIKAAWHCVTRLRFNVVDTKKIQLNDIKKIKGVMGAQFSGEQFQVIIGNEVDDAFEAVQEQLGDIASLETDESAEKSSKGIISRLMDFISGTFTPALPAIIGAGLLKGVVSLIEAFNWMPTEGAAFNILQMISDSAFYFLPFLLAVSAARKLKTSEYLAMSVAGVLLYPTMVEGFNALSAGESVQELNLFGILPVPYLNYSTSVIPILLAVWFLSHVYQWIKKWMPKSVTLMFSPVLTLLIVVPVTLIVLGPIGTYIGTALSGVILWLFENVGILAGAILGGAWPLLVMTGMHWAIMPMGLQIYAAQGYDSFMTPAMMAATFGMTGATFAVLFKTKDESMKQISLSAGISALLGITEPAMYGVTLKLKKPFIGAMTGGAIAGALLNVFSVKSFGMGIPGLIVLPGYVDPNNGMNFPMAIIGSVIAFVFAFAVTWIIGFEDETTDEAEKVDASANAVKTSGEQIKIASPVNGQFVAVENLSDETFAQQIMGQTTAIQPSANEIVAPFDAEVTLIAETNHAIGLRSSDGIELLIHLGIDTVELKGQGFKPQVKQGDQVTQGDLLMEMDIAAIKEAGYDPVVLSIVTNTADYLDVISTATEADIVVGDNIAAAIN
ncbi:beta-glucoside-specific PTS transporter subunit IIABC [Tetragenococcus halophilus]|uniref:beta-glucoside-specific PTS transporter subunit IIABC n=1 Tax=Tetragenococcus halophilus TaxID=51669 RepID=UPI002563FFBF|nr:beta-glucoside-specific PTS transporter subunit IIABC [Tetragenococcus halophilus]GMG64354.1 beta-glucoside-specific PTS transporter subunit IIABC [Tetragenococcus halophilus]